MRVARQFTAWYASQNGIRPVGDGVKITSLIGVAFSRAVHLGVTNTRCSNGKAWGATHHTVPPGRVAFLHVFQAVNCLATIIWSLRDNKPNL
jgi:hypothetical protein